MRDRPCSRHRGSLIVWILVVLFLIVLVILLHPELLMPPIHPNNGRQRAQFHSMDAALELFANEWGRYPPSDANDNTGQPYCGAMKLAEATMGRDQLGFHMRSGFRADGLDPNGGVVLYGSEPSADNLRARKGPYLPPDIVKAHRLVDIYGKGHTGPFREDLYVLCDTFERKQLSGAVTGMPILYYKANRNDTAHDVNDPNDLRNIYDYRDNMALVKLGIPWGFEGTAHPLTDPKRFYLNTGNEKVAGQNRPYRADSFVLISAGFDGLYGTADDICNFDWQYRQQ